MESSLSTHRAARSPRLSGLPLNHVGLAGVLVLLLDVSAFGQVAKPVVSCESLANLELREATVTMATTVAAGEFQMPTQSSPPGSCLAALPGSGGPGGQGGPGGHEWAGWTWHGGRPWWTEREERPASRWNDGAVRINRPGPSASLLPGGPDHEAQRRLRHQNGNLAAAVDLEREIFWRGQLGLGRIDQV